MKKLVSKIWIVAAFIAVFASCTSEVDDVFEKSSAERVSDAVKNDMSILTSATNGWLMQIYGDLQYGGYNVLCNFNEDYTVTVASEMFASDLTATSHYKLAQSTGLILSFDEYNKVLHWFSDPENPEGWGTKGTGFGGDLEFRIISATEDRIELIGKKSANKIIMTPMPIGITWKDYLDQVKFVEEDMACANVYTQVGEESVPTTLSYRRFSFTVKEGEATITKRAPFIITPQGYEFYEPLEINGKTVKGFKFEKGAISYDNTDDPTVKLVCVVPPLNEQLCNGKWYFSKNEMNPTQAALWQQLANEVKAYAKWNYKPISYAYLGAYTRNGVTQPGLVVSSNYTGHIYFVTELVGDDAITFTHMDSSLGLINAKSYLNYFPTFIPVLNLFTEVTYNKKTTGEAKTFKLETDNLKAPTYIKITDTSDPTNSYKLVPTRVSNPFGT